jgi:hypothetical protein
MTISCWIILRIGSVSKKSCRENQNILLCPITFFLGNRAVYEIMPKNVVQEERPQKAIWRRITCWISKATRSRPCTLTHPLTYTHTHTHSRKQARTHIQKRVIFKQFIPLASQINTYPLILPSITQLITGKKLQASAFQLQAIIRPIMLKNSK